MCLVEAEEISKKVYFILQGEVHVMNKGCQFEYCTLGEGSVFGDISLLLNIPNTFGYFCNMIHLKQVVLLEVNQKDFVSICKQFPYSEEQMINRAKRR